MSGTFEYDVFLSHNQADKPLVRRLAERLLAAGLRVWFDEGIIQPSDDIYLAIEHGLRSDWVGLKCSTTLFCDPSKNGCRFIPLLSPDNENYLKCFLTALSAIGSINSKYE
jgi:hypothetical protein